MEEGLINEFSLWAIIGWVCPLSSQNNNYLLNEVKVTKSNLTKKRQTQKCIGTVKNDLSDDDLA